MNNSSILVLVLSAGFFVAGCGTSTSADNPSNGGAVSAGGSATTGGSVAAGGTKSSTTVASGGATTSTTSSTVGNGGTSTSSTVGSTTNATGGAVTAGGSQTAGGATSAGGSKAIGGSSASAGGTKANGGATSAGGTSASAATTGGTTSSSGTKAVGGSAGSTNSATGGTGVAGSSSTGTCPVVSEFASWPSGKGPADIGKLAVNNFKSHTGDDYGGAGYAWTFTYFGSLQFTKLTGDTANNATLITGFEPYASGSKPPPNNAANATVDDRAFGDLPLEIYIQNQDTRCKTLGLARADTQWASTSSDGITSDARYWIDDMYMITGLQVFAYRATKDQKYLDRAAKTMQAYVAKLQQSDGLFWHTQQSKAYWGRANGWVAAGMTELLLELPTGTARTSIMAAYKKQMDGLLPLQITGSGADAGSWRQVLDVATANAESSCTAMFTYALATGVKNGWLTDAKYVTAARNGWIALGNKTNATGMLDKVCPGTGQADAGSLSSQQQFYTSITLGSNDQHGQAPLLWAAMALLKTDCAGLR